MAADSVPQIMAATKTGMRNVNETGGSAWIYCMSRRKASVVAMKTSAMMTPVTPPGAIALRPQIRARSKYFVASAIARRPEPGWEKGRLSKPANCRANRRMLMGGMSPRFPERSWQPAASTLPQNTGLAAPSRWQFRTYATSSGGRLKVAIMAGIGPSLPSAAFARDGSYPGISGRPARASMTRSACAEAQHQKHHFDAERAPDG